MLRSTAGRGEGWGVTAHSRARSDALPRGAAEVELVHMAGLHAHVFAEHADALGRGLQDEVDVVVARLLRTRTAVSFGALSSPQGEVGV